jgi:nucleoside-diphosphate-sugar epimerase
MRLALALWALLSLGAEGFSGLGLGSQHRRPAAFGGACRLAASSGLSEGDAVTVVGASSAIGRRLAERLLTDGRFRVRLIANDPQAPELFKSYPAADVYVGNLAQDPDNGSGLSLLRAAGTVSRPIVPAREVLRDSDAVVIAEGTSCFPSLRWLYGLSPSNVDGRGVSNIISSMQGGRSKRLLYLSCIGANRELPRGFPPKLDANILFWVLNFFGALDAKHTGEDLVRSARAKLGVETCIVRPKLHCYESGPFGGDLS